MLYIREYLVNVLIQYQGVALCSDRNRFEEDTVTNFNHLLYEVSKHLHNLYKATHGTFNNPNP